MSHHPDDPTLSCAAPTCDDVRDLLDDHVDRTLAADAEARLESHLADCAACRGEADGLRRLLAATAELPRSVAPERDLWPAVAARLDRREATVLRPFFPAREWSLRGVGVQALAALALMTVGGLLTHLFVSPRLAPAPAAGLSAEERAEARDLRRVASAEAPAAARERWSAELASAEVEVMRAKEMLWVSALASQDGDAEIADPATAAVVAHNLRIIDQAIGELRRALERDPGNPQLAQLLLDSHRKEIQLLERLARTPVEV